MDNGPGPSPDSDASQPTSTSSSTTAASAVAQQPHIGLLHHPPSLALGKSPSSSNSNLAGSPPGKGHTSTLQPQQKAAQQPPPLPPQQQQQALAKRSGSSHSLAAVAAAAAGETGYDNDGWERPFVIGVAGGTGEQLLHTCTCRCHPKYG
jgi:hypothetical protein